MSYNPTTEHETRIIKVNKKEAEELQKYLDSKGEDKIGTIATFTANFGNSIEIDIKVCKGNPPFIDAVLFIDGCESGILEPGDKLLGEYFFGDKLVIVETD